MNQLGPGQATYIYDHSADPRALLGLLADSIQALRTPGTPIVHVRRGWLHGTHLVVTVRPHDGVTLAVDSFAALAGPVAARLPAAAPSEHDYLAQAGQLARWEAVSEPFLPLHPQGFTAVGPAEIPEGWTRELLDARDQLAGRMLEPLLASASLSGDVLLPHAARVLALCALAHPFGIGIGTLPLRSHAEGIVSATGGTADLRSAFAERFEADRAVFLDAFSGQNGADVAEAVPLRLWNEALHSCWGTATALAASGDVDEERLVVGGPREAPLKNGVPSPFHRTARQAGIDRDQPYWHVAHRLLLNVLYSTLVCLGIKPVQRYYLCFGLSSAADALLGEDWSQRIERIAAERDAVLATVSA